MVHKWYNIFRDGDQNMTFGEDLDQMAIFMILWRKVIIMLSQSKKICNQNPKSCLFMTNQYISGFKDQENMIIGEVLDQMDICMTLLSKSCQFKTFELNCLKMNEINCYNFN